MKMSAAAIQDAIDLGVFGFPFGAGSGPAGDGKERIVAQVRARRGGQRLEAGGGFAAMGKEETFAPSNPLQHAFRVLAKFQHRHGLHEVEVS